MLQSSPIDLTGHDQQLLVVPHELLATTIDGAARVARQRVTTAATASPRHPRRWRSQTQYLPRIMIDLARGRMSLQCIIECPREKGSEAPPVRAV